MGQDPLSPECLRPAVMPTTLPCLLSPLACPEQSPAADGLGLGPLSLDARGSPWQLGLNPPLRWLKGTWVVFWFGRS